MRKHRRALLRAKANRLSKYGKNGKSIAIFRMMWEENAKSKRKAQKKAKQDKHDNAIASAIKRAKENFLNRGKLAVKS